VLRAGSAAAPRSVAGASNGAVDETPTPLAAARAAAPPAQPAALPASLPVIDAFGPFVPVLARAGLHACSAGASFDGVAALTRAWRALPPGERLPPGTFCAREYSIALRASDAAEPLWTKLYRTKVAVGGAWFEGVRDALRASSDEKRGATLQQAGAVVCALAKQGRFSAPLRVLAAAGMPVDAAGASDFLVAACAHAEKAAAFAALLLA